MNTISRGSMQTFKRCPSALMVLCLLFSAISFVPKSEIKNIVANTPSEAPLVSVTIVVTVVVVTVEIMADNRSLFRRQDTYKVY